MRLVEGRRRAGRAVLLAGLGLLAGCSGGSDLAGAVTGGAAAALTANPLVGFSVGVSVRAVSDIAVDAIERHEQRAEQNAIAAIVGRLPVGATAAWQVRHGWFVDDQNGWVQVTRLIETPLATCKEAAIAVYDPTMAELRRRYFTTAVCRNDEGWRWALGEPATERWGLLQVD